VGVGYIGDTDAGALEVTGVVVFFCGVRESVGVVPFSPERLLYDGVLLKRDFKYESMLVILCY
jgi:hypothetical protein